MWSCVPGANEQTIRYFFAAAAIHVLAFHAALPETELGGEDRYSLFCWGGVGGGARRG